MKLLDEYRIEITEYHLKGTVIDIRDCIGARAFRDAINKVQNVEDVFFNGTKWGNWAGRNLSVHGRTVEYEARDLDGNPICMMRLTEKDLGKTVIFKRVKYGK